MSFARNPLFPLSTSEGVEFVFEEYFKLQEQKFHNQDVLDLMIDFETAFNRAELTEKMKQCIDLYYFKGYSYAECGRMVGTSGVAVFKNVQNGLEKIAKVFRDWEYDV